MTAAVTDVIRRRNYGRNHAYYLGDEKLMGVTTALSEGVPKPGLMYWSAKAVAEYVADMTEVQLTSLRQLPRAAQVAALKEIPWAQRDAAALRGTELHNLAEELIHGAKVTVPEHQVGLVESVVKFMNEWKVRPVLVEKTVGSRRYRYAGTLDVIADLPDGRRVLFDYKTSASGIFSETALQLAAYRWADCYLDVAADGSAVEIPMEEVGVTEGMAVWVRSDGYDVYPLNTGPEVFRTFLAALHIAKQRHAKKGETSTFDGWKGEAVRP